MKLPHIVALIYKLVYIILLYALYILDVIRKVYVWYGDMKDDVNPPRHVLTSKLPSLQKLPVHLALAADSDFLSLDEIARVVSWSLACNIRFLTLYDSRGASTPCLEIPYPDSSRLLPPSPSLFHDDLRIIVIPRYNFKLFY